MRYIHGTTSTHLPSIYEHGLLPPSATSRSSEKRAHRLDQVHLLKEEYLRMAGAYALRAVEHWGGEPVIISGEIPDSAARLAADGKGRFPDIYTAPYVPLDNIEKIIKAANVLDDGADISELFKQHK